MDRYDYNLPKYEVPKDAEGYIASFDLSQKEELTAFFHKFGFVVVNNILSKEECDVTIDEIFQILTKKKISRDDLTTWKQSQWKQTGLYQEGILGYDPFFTPQALKNRQNPRLYELASTLLSKKELLVNHDRYGFFRPTKLAVDGEDWTTSQNIHLDMSPWSFANDPQPTHSEQVLTGLKYKNLQDFIAENNEVGVAASYQLNIQGLINLADNREEDGGFQIVPGFSHHIVDWAQATAKTLGTKYGQYQTFVVLPRGYLDSHAIRVTARAGAAVIWDQRTAHGSRPNQSARPRFAQFFKIFAVPEHHKERLEARKQRLASLIKDVEVTDLGAALFGFKPWNA